MFYCVAAARIDRGPNNVGEQVGANVELKCTFHHGTCDKAIWTKTDLSGSTPVLYAGNSVLQSYGGRYSVNVSPRRECILRINRLQLSDAGIFTCVDGGIEPQLMKSATLTVAGNF